MGILPGSSQRAAATFLLQRVLWHVSYLFLPRTEFAVKRDPKFSVTGKWLLLNPWYTLNFMSYVTVIAMCSEQTQLTPAYADVAFLGSSPARLEPGSPSAGLTSSLLGSVSSSEALLLLCASLHLFLCFGGALPRTPPFNWLSCLIYLESLSPSPLVLARSLEQESQDFLKTTIKKKLIRQNSKENLQELMYRLRMIVSQKGISPAAVSLSLQPVMGQIRHCSIFIYGKCCSL